MPRDLRLSFDAASRRFDLVIDAATGNLAIDSTPASAMLLSVLSDGRARSDDPYPMPASILSPDQIDPKRGWCLDCLDALGRRLGSRLWLLARAKQTETTRRSAEAMLAEALGDLERDRGLSVLVAARWLRSGVLGFVARAGDTEVAVTRGVAA